MREILLTHTRKMLLAVAGCTLMAVVSLASAGRLELLMGLAAGNVTGFVWYGVMFGRLWRSADMTVSQAKQQIVVGAVLRFLLMGAVFWAALQVSLGQFAAVVAGFGLIYVLGLVMLMRTSMEVK